MAKTYSATDIQVLEGLDAVRMRPGMYIGSTGSRGLHHLIWEIVDNAIDEASNGYATEIAVTLKKDGSCEVTDNGRGIPVDIHPQLGVSGVEVVYTQLHAGGKFNNKNYAYSGGLHGVGASVVNALSEWVTVDVFRDYSHYFIRFESYEDRKTGKIVSGHAVAPLEKVGNTRKRGTQVCFKPDPRVFEDTRFNGDTVRRRVRELAYLNRGVRFVFMDEREKDEARRRREYCYEGGLADFVRYLNTDKNTLTEPITFEGGGTARSCALPSSIRIPTRKTSIPSSTTCPPARAARTKPASKPPSPRPSTITPAAWACSRKRTTTFPARIFARA